MWVERHVFGSTHGYQTLATSGGLSQAERKALESYAFGTPYEASYRDSLNRDVAYWSRPVGASRRGITRVLAGQPDDAGRATLLFITAVVSVEDWNGTLSGDARPLLDREALWKWDGSQTLQALEIPDPLPQPLRLNGQALQRVLGLLSLVEVSWTLGRSVVVTENAYTYEQVAAVERLLPPMVRRRFSVVYRALNADLPASLVCVARSVPSKGSNPPRELTGAVSPYAQALVQAGLLEGRVPIGVVNGYHRFGKTQIEQDASSFGQDVDDMITDLEAERMRRQQRGSALGGLMAVLCVIAFLAGGLAGWLAHSPPPPVPWQAWMEQSIDVFQAPARDRPKQLEILAQKVQQHAPDPSEAQNVVARLNECRRSTQLAYEAEQAVGAVKPDDQSSVNRSNDAIASLAEVWPAYAGILELWLHDRARDTLKEYAVKLIDRAQSLLRNMPADATGMSHDQFEQAQSLSSAIEVLEGDGNLAVADLLRDAGGDVSNLRDRVAAIKKQEQEEKAQQQTELQEARQQDEAIQRTGRELAIEAGNWSAMEPSERLGALRAWLEGKAAATGELGTDFTSFLTELLAAMPAPVHSSEAETQQQKREHAGHSGEQKADPR
jgi:hypothetical protein